MRRMTVAAPHLAISMHAWDPYYDAVGPNEKPTKQLTAHLDALGRLAPALSRVRVDMGWSAAQPKNAPPTLDNYYNRRFVTLFTELAKRGLKPYVVLHQSPAWARSSAWDGNSINNNSVKRYPDHAAAITPFAEWAAATYAPWVSEWEAWNEPNLTAFTGFAPGGRTSSATAAAYVPVLKAIATGVRAGNKAAKVVGFNVSQADAAFIDAAYHAGAKDWCDVVGFHAYQGRQAVAPGSRDIAGITQAPGWQKARLTFGIPAIFRVLEANGDTGKPVWNTESGWAADAGAGVGSDGVPGTWPTRDAKAAAYLTQWLEMLATGNDAGGHEHSYEHITLSTHYQLFDPLTKDQHQAGFAAVTADGTFKPQADALAAFRKKYPVTRPIY